MSRKFLIAIGVIMAIMVGIYAYVGGFSEPKVLVATSEPLLLAGQPFKGTVKDEAFGNAFQKAAKLLAENKLQGVLGNVYYSNPESKTDTIRAFIGVVIQDSTISLPEGYELLRVPGGRQVVHSEINAHYMIAPGKLYTNLFAYAEENKLKLEEFYVEWFPADRKAVLEVPLKE
ncbi:GyrI-like domain-containing protein [Pontibacter sp. Tf4]|uniref:GyrI-like domain-containing protein n=1 Tax=Pontibacter sp. Tf4 TaxID=2761620 RepID=UPI001623F2A9|nr:GyrI-like domain-containing protein [Pontibacter sp. Tf4]MBB6609488.1 GyrI-like domain-containing protein [Pontibacter sp. Tf4]